MDRIIAGTAKIIRNIYEEMGTHLAGYYSQIQALFSLLMIRLLRSLSTAPSLYAIPRKINDNMRTRIIDSFFDRYREHLTIQDLASELHLSTKQTNRILHKYYQTSFKQKQLITRIQVSMDLLKTSQLTVEDISEQVGFSTVYNFSKLFKQKTGLTPTQYREQTE